MSTPSLRPGASRFVVDGALGEGGMAAVHRARDLVNGRTVALKRLTIRDPRRAELLTALFEREYHTLAQLAHPSVIDVYDYGVDAEGPYYTMELLEGQDLRQVGTMTPQELCGVLYDVTSCLALVHARRLVHRDVTRRNIRVVAPGHAKLIDFGALAPMGPTGEIVGTPLYVAPEAVMMQPLDGRADLYAVGVVLYRELTGRYPYAARSIGDLRAAFRKPPLPPHELAGDVPHALSMLAMSLIALDREARPRNAGEVMERLASIGRLDRIEPPEASRAYVITPTLVGRQAALRRARERLIETMHGRGGSLIFTGPPGVGRSRMLDAAVLEAKVLGAVVLRVARRAPEDFAAALSLVEQLQVLEPAVFAQLQQSDPELLEALHDAPAGETADEGEAGVERRRLAILGALRKLLLDLAANVPVVLAADDVQLMDERSIALLASLLKRSGDARMLLIGTMPTAKRGADAGLGLRLLLERSEQVELSPLGPEAMRSLMRSIFGAVPNVDSLADRLHRLGHGHPREAIELAEHMIDRGAIDYRTGGFVLPATFDDDIMPESMAAALLERVRALSPLALELAQAQALWARRGMSLEEFVGLAPGAGPRDVHRALDELLMADVLAFEGVEYVLRHEGIGAALRDSLDDAALRQRHRALARLLELHGSDPLAQAHHTLLAGDVDSALEQLQRFVSRFEGEAVDIFGMTRLDADELSSLFSRALDILEQRGETSSGVQDFLRYFTIAMGVFGDARWFYESAPMVEEYLERATGYLIWRDLDPAMDPLSRVVSALQEAQKAYDADRTLHRFPPADAVRHLVQYAAAAIAVGARSLDVEQRRRLPALLEPYAPLSPLIASMLENCRSAAESTFADYESAAARLEPVVEALSATENAALEHAGEIRAACQYAIGAYRARLGIPEAARWLELVADHPRQASNVLRTRALLALHRGDWLEASALREAAQEYDLEHDSKQMFGLATITGEVDAYARGFDLSAVRQLIALAEPLAEQAPGWGIQLGLMRAEYDRLRGDLDAALVGFDRCAAAGLPASEELHPDAVWYAAEAGALEVLFEFGRLEECRKRAQRALGHGGGEAEGARYDDIKRVLALCEARLGDFVAARARLSAVIDYRRELGTRGLHLGLAYEALALVTLWQGDLAAARGASTLAREELISSAASGFAGRIERLQQAFAQAGLSQGDSDARREPAAPRSELAVSLALDACSDDRERAASGLRLLCEQAGAVEGHLYLLREAGLDLAASRPSGRPPEGLAAFVASHVAYDRGIERTEHPTLTAAKGSVLTTDAVSCPSVWSAPRPSQVVFHALPIRATFGGEHSLVGIAALGYDGPAALSDAVAELADALAGYLLRARELDGLEEPGTTKS